jgi:hypothetical protein
VIDTPSSGLKWRVGQTIDFSGHGDDPEEGQLPESSLNWQLFVCHGENDGNCDVHGTTVFNGVGSGSFTSGDHEYPTWLRLVLTATDQFGAPNSTSVDLDPETVDLSFDTVPIDLDLAVGGGTQKAPFTKTVIVNSTFSIAAI